MNDEDKRLYLERYNERLRQYGYDPKALGWGGGRARQSLRFKTFVDSALQPGDSVLDVGCGFCDLFGYLRSTGWSGEYLGVDINEELLKVARQIYPEVNTAVLDIQEADLHRTYNWSFASGVFNARLKNADNATHIDRMMRRMFELSDRGVACDFMSTFVDYTHPDAFHLNPLNAIEIARRLSWRVLLRMDYLPHEFMVFVFRDHGADAPTANAMQGS